MSKKFIKEIEDILGEGEYPGSSAAIEGIDPKAVQCATTPDGISVLSRLCDSLRPSRVMPLGIICVGLAALVAGRIPGMAHFFIWSGLGLFVVSYVLFFIKYGTSK